MALWTDVSSLRNWVIGDPLLDWLDRFGADRGFVRDTELSGYAPQADLGLFIRGKAKDFEARVIQLIAQRVELDTVKAAPSNDEAFYEQTLRLMREGREAIYQGLVRDPEIGVFGVPDLIVRGDAMDRIVLGSLGELDPTGYYIVDIKFKGLSLNKNGSLNASNRWEKVQLALYDRALAHALHRPMSRAFLMGRGLSGRDGAGGGCFDQLGWIEAADPKIWDTVREGLAWLRELEESGASWSLNPPSDPRLEPGDNGQDAPWHEAKKLIAEELKPPPAEGPDVSPAHIGANRAEWIESRGLEFFVDFETINAMNDDFSSLPTAGGKAMIFMIGCGHEEVGEWNFTAWWAEHETHEEEARIIREWLDHMEAVRRRLAPEVEQPLVFHWFRHEPQELGNSADRHGEEAWRDVAWYDLLANVMKAQPVRIRGVGGAGLKPVTRTLQKMGHVTTVWDEQSLVSDGVAAMAAAWWCYDQGRAMNVPASQAAILGAPNFMELIKKYNEVDCKAMWDILRYIRANH